MQELLYPSHPQNFSAGNQVLYFSIYTAVYEIHHLGDLCWRHSQLQEELRKPFLLRRHDLSRNDEKEVHQSQPKFTHQFTVH
jgi:hypothetical protein